MTSFYNTLCMFEHRLNIAPLLCYAAPSNKTNHTCAIIIVVCTLVSIAVFLSVLFGVLFGTGSSSSSSGGSSDATTTPYPCPYVSCTYGYYLGSHKCKVCCAGNSYYCSVQSYSCGTKVYCTGSALTGGWYCDSGRCCTSCLQ